MKLKITAIMVLLSIAVVSCSSPKTIKKKAVTGPSKTSQEVQTVADNKGTYYAVLKFDKGAQSLNDASKKDLRDFIASAQREGRTINDIKILAWPDREYPAAGVRLTDRDVKIATQRSKSIEKYLKDDLNIIEDYETYNMAKRPNKISEFFKGDDYKTKRIFERSGAAPTGSNMQAFVNSKASKALIMIDYKEQQ